MRTSFAGFTFDRGTRELRRGAAPLHLEPKAFDLLDLLLARRPEAVSKPEIQARLWPDSFVSEGNITGLVTQLRQALQDDRTRSRFIRTVHGFGYAFSGEAFDEGKASPRARRPRQSVVWEQRVMPLEAGENVLGRAADATVRIDAPGVSRRHARIVVGDGRAVLEDLGSTNGTHYKESRLDAPVRLRDGDVFRLGSQVLVFRMAPLAGSTATDAEG